MSSVYGIRPNQSNDMALPARRRQRAHTTQGGRNLDLFGLDYKLSLQLSINRRHIVRIFDFEIDSLGQ